jgi:hypothetical protein
MAMTFQQLTEAKGKRVRYTVWNSGRKVYGSVIGTTPTKVTVQWDTKTTPTEYNLGDQSKSVLHRMDIVGPAPKTLTRSAITKAIEDAVLIGVDLGNGKFGVADALSRKEQLLHRLLGTK